MAFSIPFEIEIKETHHRHKKDAPSGTAKGIAREVASAKGWDMGSENITEDTATYGKNKEHRIRFEVKREGEVIGDHSVAFKSAEETLVLSHHAQSRDAFAKGALGAAKFAVQQKNGLFNMQDVLGIKK